MARASVDASSNNSLCVPHSRPGAVAEEPVAEALQKGPMTLLEPQTPRAGRRRTPGAVQGQEATGGGGDARGGAGERASRKRGRRKRIEGEKKRKVWQDTMKVNKNTKDEQKKMGEK